MKPLRARLSLGLLLSIGGLLSGVGGLVAWTLLAGLRDGFDQDLETRARVLASAVILDASGRPALRQMPFMASLPQIGTSDASDPPREYVQLWSGDGRLIEQAMSLRDGTYLRSGETAQAAPDLPRDVVPSTQPRFRDVLLPDGRSGRMVQWDVIPAAAEDGALGPSSRPNAPSGLRPDQRHQMAVLLVAMDRRQLDRHAQRVVVATVSTILTLLVLVGLLVRRAVQQGLEPLRHVSHQVQQIGARNWKRIQMPQSMAELEPVVQQLNALLQRLEEAFDRERRLSSNIAHELRTPIAELRNLAEVGTRWPDKQDMVRQFFGDVQDISAQMEKTVTHLLALARYESGLEIVRQEVLDVESLVDDAWRPLRHKAARRAVTLQRHIEPNDRLRSDPDKLELILNNLLDNAMSYSPEGSTVTCRSDPQDGLWTLAVVNPVQDLTVDDLPHLFDRFWRKDPARSDHQHHGLGLSLVKAFADLLGIDLRTRLIDGQLHMELCFELRPGHPPEGRRSSPQTLSPPASQSSSPTTA